MSGLVLGISGLAISLGGMGMSLGQAAKSKKQMRKATQEAKVLQSKAKLKAEKDFYAGLNVPLDAFGEQYRQTLQANQQGVQALQEGDSRNLAAGLGGLQGATAQAQETTRIGMQDALYENDKMKADAKETMKQQLINIDLGQAQDSVARSELYGRERNTAMAGALSSLGSAVGAANDIVPLFGKSGGDAAAAGIYQDLVDAGKAPMSRSANPEYSKADAAAAKTAGGTYDIDPYLKDANNNYVTNKLEPADAQRLLRQQGYGGRDMRRIRKGKYDYATGEKGIQGYDDFDMSIFYPGIN
tara:strand:- start:1227 stop:2126 length:900 start_codon:yes stop_codon:yes gene_type:complete